MLIAPTDLQHFLAICETHNISRAAERSGISQPALSLALQRVEQALGVPVFVRGRKGVVLTRAGEELWQQAQSLLQQWQRLTTKAQSAQSQVQGRLSIGAHPSVALYSLPGLLKKIMDQYPQVELHLAHDLSRRITEQVVSQRLDIGLVINPVPHPDLVIRPLAQDRVGFWQAPGQRSKSTLLRDTLLICDPELLQTQSLLKKIPMKLRFHRFLHSNQLELIRELVAQGVGVGILPQKVVQDGAHQLQLLEQLPIFKDQLSLVYRVENKHVAVVHHVAQVMAEHLKEK